MSVQIAIELNKPYGPELETSGEWHEAWKKNANSIEGWIGSNEQQCLYNAARITREDIIEIGSFKGKSTVQLAAGLKVSGRDGTIHVIDHFPECFKLPNGEIAVGIRAAFQANIRNCEVEDRIIIHQDLSQNVANEFIDNSAGLIFIDGSHDYEGISRDFKLYLPKLISGGLMLIHDIAPKFPDVIKFALEVEADSWNEMSWVTLKDSLGVFVRRNK